MAWWRGVNLGFCLILVWCSPLPPSCSPCYISPIEITHRLATKISREIGYDKTVVEYIDFIARKKLRTPEGVRLKAQELCNKITDFYPTTHRSMQAWAYLVMGYEELEYTIPWKTIGTFAATQNVRNLVRGMHQTLASQCQVYVKSQIARKRQYRR